MFKIQIEEFLLFNESEYKAFTNSIIIPLILTLFSSNLLIGLSWILLVTVIYKFIHKNKTENAKVFFKFIKILTLIFLSIIIFTFLTIII